jgi:hypothetical protein
MIFDFSKYDVCQICGNEISEGKLFAMKDGGSGGCCFECYEGD